jgi:hypothetical protein
MDMQEVKSDISRILYFTKLKNTNIYLLNGAENIVCFDIVNNLLKKDSTLLLEEDILDGIWYKTVKYSFQGRIFIFGYHDDIGCYFEIVNGNEDKNSWLPSIIKTICEEAGLPISLEKLF